MEATNTIDWRPLPKAVVTEGDGYWAERAWGIAEWSLSDFGVDIQHAGPDAFHREADDRFAFRVDSAGQHIIVRVEVSWQDAEDSQDSLLRVEIVGRHAVDLRAEIAAERERVADWRAKAAEFRMDLERAVCRAEAAEQELRDLRAASAPVSLCDPCREAGRESPRYAMTADDVDVCKECFEACGPQPQGGDPDDDQEINSTAGPGPGVCR